MKIKFILLSLIFVFSFAMSVQAKQESASVMSKNCDQEKVKKIAGDALVKISAPQDWGGLKGFLITLDGDKMTLADFAKKMAAAGCN